MESAEYEIRLRDAFSQGLGRIESRMNKFESSVGGLGKTIAGVFGGLTVAGLASKAVNFIGDVGSSIVSLGAEMEQTKISFETMLGSADKASKTLKDLQDFAKVTPFSQKDVVTGAKQLLGYGFEAKDLIKTLTTLGDISAGLSIPIGELTYLFGTLKTQGRAFSKDINQFLGRGINLIPVLAKQLGVLDNQVMGLVEDGKVGFEDVKKAFETMTAKGSIFGGLMAKQGQSLAGRWSTFKDTLEIMGTNLGTKILPTLGKMLDTLSSIVNVIPDLDFGPLTDVFYQLNTEIDEFIVAFNSLFGLTKDSVSTFDALTFALRYVAFAFRNAFLPIRIGIELISDLVIAIKGAVNIFQGFGQLLKGVFTLDADKIGQGVDTISNATASVFHKLKNSLGDFAKREAEGYGKLFSPFGGPGKEGDKSGSGSGTMSGLGGGSKLSSASASEVGVQRIQSGNKNITVNIQKLIEKVTFEKGYKDSEAKLQEMITKAVLTSVNDVNIVAQ